MSNYINHLLTVQVTQDGGCDESMECTASVAKNVIIISDDILKRFCLRHPAMCDMNYKMHHTACYAECDSWILSVQCPRKRHTASFSDGVTLASAFIITTTIKNTDSCAGGKHGVALSSAEQLRRSVILFVILLRIFLVLITTLLATVIMTTVTKTSALQATHTASANIVTIL